ncbi:MAG: choice-of-anchor D domain-containing protein, partial [Bacteroidota bacterium]
MIQLYLCILALCLLPVIGHDHSVSVEAPCTVAQTFRDAAHGDDSSAWPTVPASKLSRFIPDSMLFPMTGIGYFRDDTMLLRYPGATNSTLLRISQQLVGNLHGEGFFGVTTGPLRFAGDSVVLPLRFAPDTAGIHNVIAFAVAADTISTKNDTAAATIYGTAARIPLHFASGVVDFGTVAVGSWNTRSDSLTLSQKDTLGNPATLDITGYSITGDIASFSIDTNISRPDTINDFHRLGARLRVIFQPRTATQDTNRATLTIQSNYGLRTIALRGRGVDVPVAGDSILLLPPDVINFGTVAVGKLIDSQLQVINTDASTVDVTIDISDSTQFHLTDQTRRFTLAPKTSRNVHIRFQPTATGIQSAALLVSSTGNFSGRVNLTGNGFSRSVTVTRDSTTLQNPDALGFTGGFGACTTIPLIIRNSGTDTVILKSFILGKDAIHFSDSLTNNPQGVAIPPGAGVNWLVRFCPTPPITDSSTKSVSIILVDTRDSSTELAHLNLSGNIRKDSTITIIEDSLAIAPVELRFGPVEISVSDTLAVTLTNTGPETIFLKNGNIVYVRGTQSVFTLLSLPSSITPGAKETALIRYSPTAATADTAEWHLQWGKRDSLSIIKLSGNGISPSPGNVSLPF